MPRLSLAFIALLCLRVAPLGAQSARALADIETGTRLRIEAPGIAGGRYEGTVMKRTGDSLTIGALDHSPIELALARVTSFQISRGNSRAAGAARGLLWGLPMGLAFGALAVSSSSQCQHACVIGDHRKLLRLSIASGIVWGAGCGALIGHERWEPRRVVLPSPVEGR